MAPAGSIVRPGLLLIASLVFALGVAEAVLRWRSRAVPAPSADPAHTDLRGLREIRSMRALVEPNVSGQFSGAPYRNNGFGFRGPDVSETPLPGVVRIEVIGDSFTAGSDGCEASSGMAFEHVRLSALDAHPNREGHAVLARALYDGLASLPRRCLRAASPEPAGG